MGYRRLLILPSVVVTAGALWGAFYLVRHSIPVSTLPATEQSAKSQLKQPLHNNAFSEAPTIRKAGAVLHLSYKPNTTAKIQKVEFYADKTFLGVAYGVPYAVSVPVDTLAPGQHDITATVYMVGSSPQVFATTYTSGSSDSTKTIQGTTTDTTPEQTTDTITTTAPAVDAPTDVQAVVQNGTVVLTWTAPAGVNLSYQIWRDDMKLATMTDTTYTDKSVMAGKTYDYQIVAVIANNQTSAPSDTAAITVPAASTTSAPKQQSSTTSSSV